MASSEDLKNVLYFFDHPTVPIFFPRGLYQNVYFDVPECYYPKQYQSVAIDYKNECIAAATMKNGKIISIQVVAPDLNLDIPQRLSKKAIFTVFDPFHQHCAAILIGYLTECSTETFLSLCVKISLANINPHLFTYALAVGILHREDTKHLTLPSPIINSPEFYVDHGVIKDALDEAALIKDENKRHYIDIPPTASNSDIENRVAYFREDIGINLHHWHWHVVYPFSVEGSNALAIVQKDRRGELFYYMHQQMLARYNIERFCNELHRATSLAYFRDPIPEPYFPKLETPYTKDVWASRHVDAVLKDIHREPFNVKVLDIELWRDRILNSIHAGCILEKQQLVSLNEDDGIDVLGNIVEASMLSKNPQYYGNLHNMGHVMISYLHDPENKYLESIGVMGDNRTAVRDPIFYRWHTFINDIFQEYKNTLPSYTKAQLEFKGVKITDFKVVTLSKPELNIEKPLQNEFITYQQLDKVNLAYGLDIKNPGAVYLRFPHLQHQDFEYQIEVENVGEQKTATVRIFLAPSRDETNAPYTKINPSFVLKDQRRFFIELDKFKVTLQANTSEIFKRSSKDSSVTIPFKQMFADIDNIMKDLDTKTFENASNAGYCGCGWPHYMLIPKGHSMGYPCHLFVMFTDYEEDEVDKSISADEIYASRKECKCTSTNNVVSSVSFCGLKNKKYPDKKPMGYPFDRPPETNVRSIYDFLTENMRVIDVQITFKNITLNGETIGTDEIEEKIIDEAKVD